MNDTRKQGKRIDRKQKKENVMQEKKTEREE